MNDESTLLWQMKVQPLLEVLHRHVTVAELEALRDEARNTPETPTEILAVIDTLYHLRLVVEKL